MISSVKAVVNERRNKMNGESIPTEFESVEAWQKKAEELFGDDPMQWKF